MATITCDNCTESEVWTKIGTATDGDTVVLPNNLPTGGTFTLTYAGQTTSAIAYNASAATVQSALEALSNIGVGEATVIDYGAFAYRVTFSGSLGLTDLALMTAANSLTPTTGRDIAVMELVKGTASKNEIQVIRMGSAWSSQHILAKAIKLEGAGMDNTVLINNFSGGYWIRFDLPTDKLTEITGIMFRNGTSTGSGNIDSNSTLRFVGDSTSSYQLRVHHCRFDGLRQWPVFCTQVRGVFDHNEWLRTEGGGAYVYGISWKADPPTGSPGNGDGSWAFPTDAGSDNAMFFENNFFDQTNSIYDRAFFDGTRGGRAVVRYNTFTQPVAANNAVVITCHGLEGRNRSIRHFEFYNNYIITANGSKLTNNRGGTMTVFNNRVAAGATGATTMGFQCDREGDPYPWGRASGSNKYDVNDPNGGTNTAPIPFYTGVMAATTTTDFIKVSPSPGWTPVNKWVGYSVSDLDQLFPAGGVNWRPETAYLGGVITASTADTITTAPATTNAHTFAQNDNFIIQRCLHAMDQIGRAGTSSSSPNQLMTGGATESNPPVWPTGSNEQQTEPLYAWNNIKGVATPIEFSSGEHALIRAGVHFINGTVKPGYPWTANITTLAGAEDYTNVTLTGSATNGKGGFTYPHPLVEAPSGSKIINVPSFRDFGNVITGETSTYDIPVQNLGDTLLSISGVTDPNVYVVTAPLNFTVGPGATVFKTVTFSPVAETTYAGDIVFASDATSGNGTMAVTGVGVAPSGGGGGGHGKGHKKGVLVARGR